MMTPKWQIAPIRSPVGDPRQIQTQLHCPFFCLKRGNLLFLIFHGSSSDLETSPGSSTKLSSAVPAEPPPQKHPIRKGTAPGAVTANQQVTSSSASLWNQKPTPSSISAFPAASPKRGIARATTAAGKQPLKLGAEERGSDARRGPGEARRGGRLGRDTPTQPEAGRFLHQGRGKQS